MKLVFLYQRWGCCWGSYCIFFRWGKNRNYSQCTQENFSLGAISLAKWLVKKKPGLYTISDMLI